MGLEGFIIVSIFFVVGGLATSWVNRRQGGNGARQRWIKYWVYVVIVFGMMALIRGGWIWWVALVLTTIAFYEIVTVAIQSKKRLASMIGPVIAFTLIAFLFLLFASGQPASTLMFVYVIVLTFDGFSQLSGQLFGKTKLVAKVSPGKTVEGLLGGLAMALLAGWLMRFEVPGLNVWWMSTIVAAAALAGDLLASAYKRWCGVKDFSDLIPGHGGVLDRFDSFFGASVVWQLVTWI